MNEDHEEPSAFAAAAARGREFQAAHPVDHRRIVSEQLAQCHEVLGECWRAQRSTTVSYELQLETMRVAALLMKINLRQYEALSGRPREFTHRIIVERASPPVDFAGQPIPPPQAVTAAPPPPPGKILKTIPGGSPHVRTP
jgi:hypothetical protein